MKMTISITKTSAPKPKPDQSALGFGNHFTDHMFIMDYTEGVGWHDPRIVPYAPLSLDPACMFLHYGQGIFEGLKAYRAANGEILLFRPDMNMRRINRGGDRLCIPPIDPDFAVEATKTLIGADADWIPSAPDTSLYIRPFIIATDVHVGVRASNTYQFIIILSPVGAYYPEGLNPVKIYVEPEYVRAAKGGMGFSKTAGNYAASLKAQTIAKEKGYTQVLWLDGVERKYIEEVGTMNVFFMIDDTVVTPALNDSILAGVTRDSVIALLRSWGVTVEERKLSIDEVLTAHTNGRLREMFGTGTAAVISPVGELRYADDVRIINNGKIGALSQKLYNTITDIQNGRVEDTMGWTVKINS